MNIYIFTFRKYQKHENINMQNYFVKVIAENEQLAKDVISILYGVGFDECFPDKKFKPMPKQRLFETIKQRQTDGEN